MYKPVKKLCLLLALCVIVSCMSMLLIGCSDMRSGASASDAALVENADDHDYDGTQTKNNSTEIDNALDTNQGQNGDKKRGEFATGTQTKNNSTEIDNALDTNQGQNGDKKRGEFATLYVYGVLSGEGIAEDGRCEYTLSSEDSNVIIALFYSQEKEALETPLDCISTIEFRLGEDYLGTSLNDINVLSGRIDGKLVAVYLDEDESSILKQLVYTYAPDIAH